MKKFLSLLSLSMLAGSAAMAAPISPESALQRLSDSNPNAVATRAMNAVPELKSTITTHNGQPAIYVFDLSDTKGFMFLSADDVVTPLLGYSETGSFDPDNMPPALQNWLEQYSDQIEYARTLSPTLTRSDASATRATLPSSWAPIEPLVKTVWNQNAPFYNLCPKYQGYTCYTGCVATSMAQVMNYFQYPAKGQGSISYKCTSIGQTLSLDFSTVTFDWKNMRNSYNETYTAPEAYAVAALMQATGYSVEMSYSPNSSGAISGYIPGALVKYFDYDPSVMYVSRSMKNYNEWATLIYNNLKNVGPVIYDGDTDFSGGHSFICDGYQGNGYFHFNWGWGGTADGYYLLDVLNPSTIGIGGASGGFNFRQDIVLNIQPKKAGSVAQDQIVMSGSMKGSTSQQYLYLQIYGNQYPGIRYYGLSEAVFNLGARFEPVDNPNGGFYQACSNNSTFKKYWLPLDSGHIMFFDGTIDYPFPMYVLGGLNFDNNVKYKVTMAYQLITYDENGKEVTGEWTEMPAGNGDYNYFYLTKSGNSYNIESFDQAQFSCDQLKLESALYDGNAAKFSLKLTNNTDIELTRGVTLMLLDAKDEVVYLGDSFVETLSAGQSFSREWTTELTRQLTSPLNKATDFYPALYDIDTETVYYKSPLPVTMQPNPGTPTYNTYMTLDNATYNANNKIWVFETSTKMEVSVEIEVTNGYFSYPVSIFVMQDIPGTNNLEVLYTTNMDIEIIEKGQSNTFNSTLNFPSLEVGKEYSMGVTINNSNKLEIPEMYFMVESNEAGIESIGADGALKCVYDRASGRVFTTGDAASIEIYSLAGVKLASSAEGSVDVSSLGKGVIIVTATSRSGERVSTKLAL